MERRFRKDDVELHSDGFGRRAHPAINVKVYHYPNTDDVVDKFGCSEDTAEQALQFAFDSAAQRFWEDMGEVVQEIFPGATMYQEGRGGGWLTVHGLHDVEDWDGCMVAKWGKLARIAKQEIDYLCAPAYVMEDIEANRWAEEGAQMYNFLDHDGETLCMVDVKQEVNSFSDERFGIVAMA